jgi:diphthine-ammonia ligase
MAINTFALSSWNGGKDSCLACFKARQSGYPVKYLLNFISKEYRRTCFHGIDANLLVFQANLTGIQLIQHSVSSDMKQYENEFKSAVLNLKNKGAGYMAFGDIYLDEHRQWGRLPPYRRTGKKRYLPVRRKR